jgi:hypothetical protein
MQVSLRKDSVTDGGNLALPAIRVGCLGLAVWFFLLEFATIGLTQQPGSISAEETAQITKGAFEHARSLDSYRPQKVKIFFFPIDASQFLGHPVVIKELKLTDEQITKGRLLRQEGYALKKELLGGSFEAAEGEEAFLRVDQSYRNILGMMQDGVKRILTSEQLRRFEELRLQARLLRNGVIELTSLEMSKALQLTSAQQSQLVRVQKEFDESYAREARRLFGEILKEYEQECLTGAQQRELKELTGFDNDELLDWNYDSVMDALGRKLR